MNSFVIIVIYILFNGFCESQNNKVKLVKRNAFGYKYFINLRKRILLHLGFRYTLNFEETKKG
ncbi:transposase [Kandleria vitulina]|uniref:transposase n=1 Tax=Kandleria vitulina TaxID=1630 RepID=UPI003B75C9B7